MCLTFLTEGSSSLDLHHYRHILRASINVEPGVTLIFWQSRLKMPFKELLLYVQYIHQQNQHILHVITEPAGFSYLLSVKSFLSNLIFRDFLTDLIKEKYAPGKIYNKTNCFFSPKFIKICTNTKESPALFWEIKYSAIFWGPTCCARHCSTSIHLNLVLLILYIY